MLTLGIVLYLHPQSDSGPTARATESELRQIADSIELKISRLRSDRRPRATCKISNDSYRLFLLEPKNDRVAFQALYSSGLARRWDRESYYQAKDASRLKSFVKPTSFLWQRAELLNDRVTAVLKAKEFYTKWQANAKSDYYANMLLFDALSIGVKVPEKPEVIKDRVKALLPESDERWLLFQAKYLKYQRSQQPSAVSLAQVKGAFERYIAVQTDTPATNRYLSDRLLVMLK